MKHAAQEDENDMSLSNIDPMSTGTTNPPTVRSIGAIEGLAIRPFDRLKADFTILKTGNRRVRIVDYVRDEVYNHMINKLSSSNPASSALKIPLLIWDDLLIEHDHSRMLQNLQLSESRELEGTYTQLFGVDLGCPNWSCITRITFPIGFDIVPKIAPDAQIEPIKLQVLRHQVCLLTLHLIWVSVMDSKVKHPAKYLLFPDSLPEDCGLAKTKVGLLRKYAIQPIFGNVRHCWEVLEGEYEATKEYNYYWPLDCLEAPDLPQVREYLASYYPDSASICDLLEAMIGPKPYFPIYATKIMEMDMYYGTHYE